VETNPPRNNRLKLIEADECRGGRNSCPGIFQSRHRIDRFLMPQKLTEKVAAQRLPCSALPSCASNSAGGI
jgi:hypothetical protein